MIDTIEIFVGGGTGGSGAISFRREKYVPFGGPDGGDGGSGGDVVVVADPGVTDLKLFRRKRRYKAGVGGDGRGRKRHGKNGEALILPVPVGTVVYDEDEVGGRALVADLEKPGERVVVARGGKGGLGNIHFASSTNQAPRIAQSGEKGEEKAVSLEMRLIADVGIIGYPNVGKSTLLAAASAARPKIASYPFTTREPVLGVVEVGQRVAVLAEIPGLVDGAHTGRGLGHDFLRHIVRTRIIIHLVDGSSVSPVEDMTRVNAELGLYDSSLAGKQQIVAVNKIDLPQVQAGLDEIRGAFGGIGISPLFISAATGEGVTQLMMETVDMLSQVGETDKRVPSRVFRPRPRDKGVRVHREGEAFVVEAPGLERIVARVDMSSPQLRGQLDRQLTRLGVRRALDKAGVKPGDRVRCGDLEWEW